MILIVTDAIPTPSFKRSGIFGFDDFQFFSKNNDDVKMLILYRITFDRRFLWNFKTQVKVIYNQIKEIKAIVTKNENFDFIPYFSLIKPFVFKEDLFLLAKSKFSKQAFDLIVVHNMLHTGLAIKWIRKQFPGSKIILKEHSNWLLYSKLVRYFAIKYVKYFDKIFANSEYSRKTFQQIFLQYKKYLKGPTPIIEIDYPRFTLNTTKIIKPHSNKLRILTIANLLKSKGFEESFTILKVLEETKIEWFWEIIGKGIFYQEILEFASNFNFLDKIEIIPELQKPALFENMKKADIYLQLSYRETFGIAPIEAFSYYTKLIVTDQIASINELGLTNNKNVLIIKNINDIISEKERILNFIAQKESVEDFENIIPILNNKINSDFPY